MEKEYLIFIGNKKVFCDCEEDLKKYTKNLKSLEFSIYKKIK